MAYQNGNEGVLFAIDNDGAPPHRGDAQAGSEGEPCPCRECGLRFAANLSTLSWRAAPIRWMVVVPVQTLETWLLAAKGHPFVGPAELPGRTPVERRELKRCLYGSEEPDRDTMLRCSTAVLKTLELGRLRDSCPSFGAFEMQVTGPLVPMAGR